MPKQRDVRIISAFFSYFFSDFLSIRDSIKMAIKLHLLREKWTPESVVSFILACRRDKGLPIFKSKFAGIPFETKEGNAVMAVCWAGEDFIGSRVFTGVPKGDIELIEEGFGDWKKLLRKYSTEEDLRRALRSEVIIGGKKSPLAGSVFSYFYGT